MIEQAKASNENLLDDRADVETVFSSWEGIAIASTSAIVSIAASTLVIWLIRKSTKGLSGSVYHRILFGMSVVDIIQSLGVALATLPMPTDMIYSFEWLVLGNRSTCTAQSFVITFGTMAGLLYNTTLSLYYLCSIRYSMSDIIFKERFEFYLYGASLMIALVLSGLTIGTIHPNPTEGSWCKPTNYPWWCNGEECQGKDIGQIKALSFFSVTAVSCVATIIVSMVLIVMKVCKQEQEVKAEMVTVVREAGNQEHPNVPLSEFEQANQLRNTKVIAKQAFAYTCINVFNFLLVIGRSLLRVTSNSGVPSPEMQVIYQIFRPLQGLLNSIIFVYHKAYSLQLERPHLSFASAFCLALRGVEGSDQVLSNMLVVQRDEQLSHINFASNLRDIDYGNEIDGARDGGDGEGNEDIGDGDSGEEDGGGDDLVLHTPDVSKAGSVNDLSGFPSLPSRCELSSMRTTQGDDMPLN